MQVQVLYQHRNEITGDIEGFDHVANVDVPPFFTVNQAMEYAYRALQNTEGSWSMDWSLEHDGIVTENVDYDPNITVLKPLRTWSDGRKMGHRSAMMYDRMIFNGDLYEVDAIGFRKLEG